MQRKACCSLEKEAISGASLTRLGLIASWHLDEGDAAKAHSLLEESYALFKGIGEKAFERLALTGLGMGCLSAREPLPGTLTPGGGVGNVQGEEDPFDQDNKAWALSHLARVVAFEEDYAKARALYEQCLAIVKKMDFKVWTPFHLEGLAAVVAVQGELPWAARLWGTAEALRDGMGTPNPPAYRADYERSVAPVRTQLGEQAFTATWAEGRGMTLDQVLGKQGKAPVSSHISTEEPALSPSKSSPSYPDGLTAREVEVLRLVAQGLSNAEIAEQLIISLLTVKAHMRSLYDKLGVSSRSAATRYALEHHLV